MAISNLGLDCPVDDARFCSAARIQVDFELSFCLISSHSVDSLRSGMHQFLLVFFFIYIFSRDF